MFQYWHGLWKYDLLEKFTCCVTKEDIDFDYNSLLYGDDMILFQLIIPFFDNIRLLSFLVRMILRLTCSVWLHRHGRGYYSHV